MSAKKSVTLFYDVISPYSWLGFEMICRYQQKWNIALQLRPVFLGGIMGATGNSPPGANPAKAAYSMNDLHLLRTYTQVPLSSPSDFMGTVIQKGTLKAQRLLTAASMSTPDKLEDLSRALWMRIWNTDKDCTEPGSLLEACQAAGITEAESQKLVSRIKDSDVKEELKKATAEAVDHGAFGLPAFLVNDHAGKPHLLFGSDRIHILAYLLGEKFEGPLNELAKTKL